MLANHFPVKCNLEEASHYDVDVKQARREVEGPPGKSSRPEKAMPTELLRCAFDQHQCLHVISHQFLQSLLQSAPGRGKLHRFLPP